jgi:hypothetical protein
MKFVKFIHPSKYKNDVKNVGDKKREREWTEKCSNLCIQLQILKESKDWVRLTIQVDKTVSHLLVTGHRHRLKKRTKIPSKFAYNYTINIVTLMSKFAADIYLSQMIKPPHKVKQIAFVIYNHIITDKESGHGASLLYLDFYIDAP